MRRRPAITAATMRGIRALLPFVEVSAEMNDSDLMQHSDAKERHDIWCAITYLAKLCTWHETTTRLREVSRKLAKETSK